MAASLTKGTAAKTVEQTAQAGGASVAKPSSFSQFKVLFAKDMRREFRTKEMITSMGVYALLVLIVYGAALGQTSSKLDLLQMSGGLLWALFVFTSLLGLNRSFAYEKEQGALEGILLVPMDRGVIFLSKALSNFLFMLVNSLCFSIVLIKQWRKNSNQDNRKAACKSYYFIFHISYKSHRFEPQY